MFDQTGATEVDTSALTCPVLCLSGAEDHIVSLPSAKATAETYQQSQFWPFDSHVHMLLVEPGADNIAERIAGWLA